MTRLSDEKYCIIWDRCKKGFEYDAMEDRRALLLEVDRLREGEKLAREWLREDGKILRAEAPFKHPHREAFRAWCEAHK